MRSEPVKNSQDPRQLELPVRNPAGGAPEGAAERALAIVESLPKLPGGEEVFAAFEELDTLPPDVVREALSTWTGPAPDPERLDEATRRAHGFPPPPLRLRTIAVVKDADIFDIGDIAEEQLRLAGKAWDGADLSAVERLDGESEGSFAGTVEHRVLAEDDGRARTRALFEVLLYADEAGAIFRAGTTDLVGAIAYGVVEMKDKRARVAIQDALAQPFDPSLALEPEPAVESSRAAAVAGAPPSERAPKNGRVQASTTAAAPESTESDLPKKPAAAKPVAAKPVAAKPVAAKESAEEAPAKKAASRTPEKKPAAKKAAASAPAKATTKKAAAKKAPASAPAKATTKKAAAKKAPASAPAKATTKKPAAKKAATKKAATKKAATKTSSKR